MSLWFSQNQEKFNRAGLRARQNLGRPETAAPPGYDRLKELFQASVKQDILSKVFVLRFWGKEKVG
jgi:hypothetical protein